ncbi:MAG: peptidoglycan DD-metalloendopeptidase family protein, partial [Chlorobi bacterium]|nr:peptidoglycan DD-metalloendopeptidase family protein [Chlorobiota bacterium]
RAFRNNLTSDYSNEYYAITMHAPSNLNARPVNQNQIYLSWEDQTNNETGYFVERKVSDKWKVIDRLPANSYEYLDANVTKGIEYRYRVRAYANSGQPEPHYSGYSKEAKSKIDVMNEPYGFLFPLQGEDPYTAEITAIFDHDARKNSVVAFTGENDQDNLFIINGNYRYKDRLEYDGHDGIDYPVGSGTNVYAVAAGKVIYLVDNCDGCTKGFGNYIKIDHENGYVTLYAHLSEVEKRIGDRVQRGEIIAKSGSTGQSTGPHLHFQVYINGIAVDPYGWQGIGEDPYKEAPNEFLWDVYTDKTVWNFDKTFEKWRTRDAQNRGVVQEGPAKGKWKIDPGEDPGIVSPRLLNIHSNDYPKIQIRMSFYGGGNSYPGKPVIYFKPYGYSKFKDDSFVEFNKEVIPDGNLYIYEADIPEKIGQIKEIRIDLVEKGDPDFKGDYIYIDYVRFIHHNNLTVISHSPVDLKLYSPNGLFVQKDTTNIFDASYEEFDIDDDQELEDIISINNPEEGTYFLSVIPDSTAKPEDVFVVLKIENGDTSVVIDTTRIKDIPDSLYQIQYQKITKVFVQDNQKIPSDFDLYQNYPNPFNAITYIQFKLSKTSHVNLEIYDIIGRKIETVLNKKLSPGYH